MTVNNPSLADYYGEGPPFPEGSPARLRRLPGEGAVAPQGTALSGAVTPWHYATPALSAADLDPGPRGPFRLVGLSAQQDDAGQLTYLTPDGRTERYDPSIDVVDRSTGQVYRRNEPPPNQPAAQASQAVGLFGKLLDMFGVTDYSGDRARTSWGQAVQNTLAAPSLANMAQGALTAADRLMTERTSTGRPDPLAAAQGLEVGGALAMSNAPGALTRSGSSAGIFGGRIHAQNLADAGRPTALRAIEMAEAMERQGIPVGQIERDVSRWIRTQDVLRRRGRTPTLAATGIPLPVPTDRERRREPLYDRIDRIQDRRRRQMRPAPEAPWPEEGNRVVTR